VVPGRSGYRRPSHQALGRTAFVSHNSSVDRADTVHPREDLVDLATLMAIVVAVLILLSGYFLFNDVPTFGRSPGKRRPDRRR
jgi:hypothetical protein